MKLLCVRRKEKEIREFLKTLQKMRENFSTKTKKPSSFECLKLVEILLIFLVINFSLNTIESIIKICMKGKKTQKGVYMYSLSFDKIGIYMKLNI